VFYRHKKYVYNFSHSIYVFKVVQMNINIFITQKKHIGKILKKFNSKSIFTLVKEE